MHEVLERIQKLSSVLAERAPEAERLGRLPDDTVTRLKDAGIVRMLQPREFGGYQAHPADFLEAVMMVASSCGSTGWVMGVLGVHAWEMGLCDARLQREVYGENPDVWIASPYTPLGRAVPDGDGVRLNGRWPFSSGTDHCGWAFLGGFVTGAGRPRMHHFVLPRSDYEIVEDSWDVAGLKGTGSKDVVVKDAFVPKHRCLDLDRINDGSWLKELGRTEPLYHLPFNVFFGSAICSAVIGIAEGVLASFVAHQRQRINVFGGREAENVHGLVALGEAAADLAASRTQVLHDVRRLFDQVAAQKPVSLDLRAELRRNQVQAAKRAVAAADQVFTRAGGNALRLDRPIQRMWRDAHAALGHVMNVPNPIHHAWAATALGLPQPGGATLV